MTVYLDIIWILNLFFDTFLLYLTGILLKKKTGTYRLFLGGLLGSSVVLLSISPLYFIGSNPLGKLAISILMVLIAFGFQRFMQFWKTLFTFYLVTFAVGGAIIGLHYFIQFEANLRNITALHSIQGIGDPISWLFVIVGFPVAWYFSGKTLHHLEYTKIKYEQIVDVTIVILDEHIKVKGLIDSGNKAKDPLTRKPVIFVSISHLDSHPTELLQLAASPEKIIEQLPQLSSSLQNKVSVIPYQVYGQEHQLVIGVRPDKVLINNGTEVYATNDCLVSFTLQQLSPDGDFQCILHPELFMKKILQTINIS